MKQLLQFLGGFAVASTIFLVACGDDENPIDDLLETTLSLSANNTTTGESGTIEVTVRIGTSLPIDVPVAINYSGTASQGDYTGANSVTISSGETSASFDVMITDDDEDEENEELTIAIGTSGLPSQVSLGDVASVTITIIDDDTSDDPGSGNEGIGDDECPNDNSTNQTREACDNPAGALNYDESLSGSMRTVTGSGIPNHDYGNQFQDFPANDPNSDIEVTNQNYSFTFTASPSLASSTTSILNDRNRPSVEYGIALNAVPIDPAPAEPFIFEDTETGEYNWDWVFEPNNNTEAVGLDCATAHVQPDGAYHYHGDMGPLAEVFSAGISSGTAPSSPVQVGWAADGFPIFYRYGPTANGSGVELLTPSYQLKAGNRPGDGVSEPCGSYTGKYTNDYEFVDGSGDLDECNGISRSITFTTQAGQSETFSYFYVITEDFPVIGRCLSGTPDGDFSKGG